MASSRAEKPRELVFVSYSHADAVAAMTKGTNAAGGRANSSRRYLSRPREKMRTSGTGHKRRSAPTASIVRSGGSNRPNPREDRRSAFEVG